MKGVINIDQERCKGCALCIEFCPQKIIYLSSRLNAKGYFIAALQDGNECTGCATCAIVCPDAAIEVMKS